MSQQDQAILEGALSIKAALSARSRAIHTLYTARDRRDYENVQLIKLAEAAGATIEWVSRARIDELASGTTHGGLLALAGPRRYLSLAELIPAATTPFIAMLDGIEDPFTFGSALRSLYAAGADGVVMRPRNWNSAAATVARASAGASELLPMALAEEAKEAADLYRAKGLAIAIAMKGKGALSLYAADLTQPLFLLLGGERRGVQRSFVTHNDLMLEIPYGRSFAQALGTAAATAVISFEVLRQRRLTLSDSKTVRQ